ncbi:DUF6493 family protein [Luteimonas sp. SMYT11W]|uniref:DUF6493 family protein n=1 Tax=Luteimonas flava TaxID=3115822 RepID=A0ABU7WD73_9GAMM
MAKVFAPETPIEHAVHEGDYGLTLQLLRELPRQERLMHRASSRRMKKLIDDCRWYASVAALAAWGGAPTDAQEDAMFAVLVVCGTAQDIASTYGASRNSLVSLCEEFRPECLPDLAATKLADSPFSIEIVQELIAAGLVSRPDSDDYTLGLISLVGSRALHRVWAADPGLRAVILRVMEIEGTREHSLAAVDTYSPRNQSWAHSLVQWRDEGIFSQEELLDRTLAALAKDWPQFRSGWFSRFHGDLDPDAALLQARAQRYLGLCHSRIPPTVSLALAVIRKLEATAAIDDAALSEALRPVMHSQVKSQVLAALKLIDARVKRDVAFSAFASDLVIPALAHESADIQAQVLARLKQWGCSADQRDQISRYADGVAALHRQAFEDLTGLSKIMIEPFEHLPAEPRRGLGPISPLASERRLDVPLGDDAIVACISHVFENSHDTDAFEIACSALLEAAPFEPALRERLGPVIKRATKVRTVVANELAWLLRVLSSDSTSSPVDQRENNPWNCDAQKFLRQRTDRWIALASRGHRLPPISSPTHRNGFIEPTVLVKRLADYARSGYLPDVEDQVHALLRLAPAGSENALPEARTLELMPFARALRYALGDDIEADAAYPELFAAAARIRHPGTDDIALLNLIGDTGPDGAIAARHSWRCAPWKNYVGGVVTNSYPALFLDSRPPARQVSSRMLATHRYQYRSEETEARPLDQEFGGLEEDVLRFSATIFPSCMDGFFADGARAIGNNLDWASARWGDKAYLDTLLDPAFPMTPMANALLALGLAVKEPGQSALSTDILAATWMDGRLDVGALATEIGDLSKTPLIKVGRYVRSFQAAMRLEPSLHQPVFAFLCKIVESSPQRPQRDIAKVLEMLIEISMTYGHARPTSTQSALSEMPLNGKAKIAANALLTY